MDDDTKISDLKRKIRQFCQERDWDQFHNPKDLAIGLSIEANELLELFLWKNQKEIESLLNNSEKKEKISEELADILYLLLRISDKYSIDLSESFKKKLEKNKQKYPIEKAKGSNKKYNEF